ncbi:hypothetical protein PTKU15_83370 [Paraburkholderia terrae]|nr:hypothetical protein PTKU15_83370 [Paraburkholderia terrae]
MKKWLLEIIMSLTLSHDDAGGDFRPYNRFASDWQSNQIPPKVMFTDPQYTGSRPHIA